MPAESMIRHLKSRLVSALAALCMGSGPAKTVRLRLHDRAIVVCRPVMPEDLPKKGGIHEAIRENLGRSPEWKPVARLVRTIESALSSELGNLVDLRAWRQAPLPYQVAAACLAAADLAVDWRAKLLCEVREDDADRHFWQAYHDLVDDMEQAEQEVKSTIERLGREIFVSSARYSVPSSTILQLDSVGDTFQVAHLDESEKRLLIEPLCQLVDRAATPCLRAFFDRADQLSRRLADYRVAGDALLRKTCPVMQMALKRVLGETECIGYRMCRGQSRGFPAEALIYVASPNSSCDITGVHLVARRAHAEFVLENGHQPPEQFWFPPVQIQSRIFFTGDHSICELGPPEIRLPRSSPAFKHPYVGPVEKDCFSRAVVLNDDGSEAMVALSDEASRLFGPRLNPVGTSRARDMCLPRQAERLRQLREYALRSNRRHGRIDVVASVQGLWQLARQGLCRAHEENQDQPRVPLDAEHMLYTIPYQHDLAESILAMRNFRYRSDKQLSVFLAKKQSLCSVCDTPAT